jgi:squalene monooxygenase
MTMDADYDVIVVGAGVAGGSLATALARDGRRVLLLERDLWNHHHHRVPPAADNTTRTPVLCEPDRIVGELLQPGGCDALRRLDLHAALDGIDAQPVYGYGIFLGKSAMCVRYAGDQGPSVPALSGLGFHNGRFLRRLREIALEHPNITLIEGTAIVLDKDHHDNVIGVTYRVRTTFNAIDSDTPAQETADSTLPLVSAESTSIQANARRPDSANGTSTSSSSSSPANFELRHATARLTIACDGCASTLRKRVSRDSSVSVYSRFVGLVLHIDRLPFPAHGHVVLADPAPILFYPISSSEVRCLVDIPSTVRTPIGEHMLHQLAPQVPEPLRAAFIKAVLAGGFKAMPNRVMADAPAVIPGAVLLGDSFNMRHPLTGGGMTVALSDVALIRELLRTVPNFGDLPAVDLALKTFYKRRKSLSSTINILANALYSVFCATEDPALVDMRAACFVYLSSGGRMSYDPMGMLGGVKPSPALLIFHFFCVAFFGCGRALLPCPTPSRMVKAWAIFRASFNIVKPLIDSEHIFPLYLIPLRAL